jgi:hypothetical protein
MERRAMHGRVDRRLAMDRRLCQRRSSRDVLPLFRGEVDAGVTVATNAVRHAIRYRWAVPKFVASWVAAALVAPHHRPTQFSAKPARAIVITLRRRPSQRHEIAGPRRRVSHLNS